jgi:hypothetical protein
MKNFVTENNSQQNVFAKGIEVHCRANKGIYIYSTDKYI